ncbi:MAG: transcription elongation factor GreA [Myxococcales bacterium]|nr:transcription elongation factor GreA [Myxococcales bacterium]
MERVPMTPEGYERLKRELEALKADRPKISKEIGIAREHGDLRENAEYHAAKDKQGLNEARIADLEDKLARAEVIDPAELGGDRVKFGAIVELEELDSGKTVTYRLVGPEEADLDQGSISVTSPVAKALINREVGDEVQVRAPGGVRTYEIADIRWQ